MTDKAAAAPAATGNEGGGDAPVVDTLLGAGAPPAADGKTPESPAAPDKPEGDKPADTPFQFDAIKLPEGFTVPDEVKGGFTELVNGYKIPAEAAQKLVDMYAAQSKGSADAAVQVWKDMNAEWQTQIKADLGDKYEPTIQQIGKLINDPNLTDPGFKAAMDLTGAGNNPAVIKTLQKWAERMTEGGYVQGAPVNGGPKRPGSLGEALYGQGDK